ncbi:hypothetical protein [Paenibacillus typhae]|uniref:hypothetical protein n=1 Tax=Paenibacillus typhae TaxID=1174501 RepID=UPI001C8E512C|nr:hypothetical protein [Paenibacillus typhae]MBY0011509.1 hypothetical protein [Paenibacillus typhae]
MDRIIIRGLKSIDNGGAGLSINGNFKVDLKDAHIQGNEIGISIGMGPNGSLAMDDITVLENKLAGISINEWSQRIEETKSIVKEQPEDLSPDHITELMHLLEQLKSFKDDSGSTKKIIKAISSVGTGVASGTIVAALKHLTGM